MNLIFYIGRKSVTFKPRQDKTRHDKAWQGKARRGQTRQDEAAPRQEGVPWFWKILYLVICFRGRSLDTIERHLQQAVNAIQEWATRNGFRFAAHKCKVVHFTAPRSRAQRPPIVRIGNTLLRVKESTKFLGLWWDSHLSFKKHISVLKTQCKEALNLIRVVAHFKWGRDRDTLLMLYRAIVRSKFDYGCIVYGTASNANLRQLDSIHNSGLRLALGALCTSPVSSPVSTPTRLLWGNID